MYTLHSLVTLLSHKLVEVTSLGCQGQVLAQHSLTFAQNLLFSVNHNVD